MESVYRGQPGPASPYPITRPDDGGRAPIDQTRASSLIFAQPLPVREVLLLLFRLLRDYAQQHGITIVEEFIDVETAARAGRTAFGNMMGRRPFATQSSRDAG